MKQINITPAMGKRLIGMGLAVHPEIEQTLEKGTLVIVAGTTNGYVAEEVLKKLDAADGFSRDGFRRGTTMGSAEKIEPVELAGDVVISNGAWQKGATIFDVADGLKSGDVILKGGNALDAYGQVAVQIANPTGGTIMAILPAVIGRRARLIVPLGLEKRVFEDVNVLAERCNDPQVTGLRMLPLPGMAFTEFDAIRVLTGAEAFLIAGGGVYGAEGSTWLGISGTDEQIEDAVSLIKALVDEPLCRV